MFKQYQKFAGPPAHDVSEPKHQSPVPGHCSLRVLDSSPGVQKDTIYGVLGGGHGGGIRPNHCPSNSGIVFLSRSKINPEIDTDFEMFLEPKWSPKIDQNPSKNPCKIDVVFHAVFGKMFNRFPEPLNLENGAVALEGC